MQHAAIERPDPEELAAGGGRARALLLPAAILLAVAVLVRAPFVVEPPGRDQGLFMTEAGLLLNGKHLYTEIWEHKPPGVIVLYAVALLFARSYLAVQLMALVAGWLSGVGVSLLVSRLVGRSAGSLAAGVLAGALYIVFQGHVAFGGFWGTAQPEALMDPFVLAGLALLVAPSRRLGAEMARVCAAGATVGIVIFFKYSAAPVLLVFWIARLARRPGGWRSSRAFPALLAGAALPWALFLAWIGATGRFGAFRDATLAFNAVHRLVGSSPRWLAPVDRILYGGLELLPLYVLVVVGWAAFWATRRAAQDAGGARSLLVIASALWVLRLAEVYWQSKFWYYHYQVVLLPLCLAAGATMALVARALARRVAARAVAVVLAGLAIVALTPHAFSLVRYSEAHGIAGYWTGRVEREAFWRTYTWGGRDYDFAETASAAARVARDTAPDDTVFVWGFEPGIYFLSARPPASRFLYDYPLMSRFAGLHAKYVAALMDDLERHRPKLILALRNDSNAIEPLDSWGQVSQVPELRRLIETQYAPAWELGDFRCFRRKI